MGAIALVNTGIVPHRDGMDLLIEMRSLSDRWCQANDRSLPRLATIVVNDGKLFDRLATGAGCTIATYQRFLRFFQSADNWPSNEIPPDVVDRLELLCSEALSAEVLSAPAEA